jgi:hypothetical protein
MLRVTVALLLAALLTPPAGPAAGTCPASLAFPVSPTPAIERDPMPLTTVAPATPQAADLLEECTIAVLSGKSTADGRPILWKNRDSGYTDNELAYFDDGLYPYITVINAGDSLNAWIGVNEPGFAVLNALSYNLPDSVSGGITNGWLMKLALQTCATVDDFEKLLGRTSEPGRENPANFAVIDALGGAAMFEVGSHHHRRFDASRAGAMGTGVTGAGYLVRTNFSLSADTTEVETWRFRRAGELVGQVANGLARREDLFRISRDLCSALCNPYPLPFNGTPPGFPSARGYVDTRETIQRVSTVSSGLIQGVRPGEDPRLSTFFVALGKPAVAPFVPAWVAGGKTPPELDGPLTSPFSDLALARARTCYDYPGTPRLINTRKLDSLTGAGRHSTPLLCDLEMKMLTRVDSLLAAWRLGGAFPADVAAQERLLSASMYAIYEMRSYPAAVDSAPAIAWRVTPTPMRDKVWILAGPGHPGAAEPELIEVFDLAGRRIARLTGLTAHAGLSERAGTVSSGFTWDGRDESGRNVPAGLYFGRAPGASSSARILIVR